MSQGTAYPTAQKISDSSDNVINPAKEDGEVLLQSKLLRMIIVELRIITILLQTGLNVKGDELNWRSDIRETLEGET